MICLNPLRETIVYFAAKRWSVRKSMNADWLKYCVFTLKALTLTNVIDHAKDSPQESLSSLLNATPRSSKRAVKGKSTFAVCTWGHRSPLPKKRFFRGKWRHLHVHWVLCNIQILRTFECWSSLLWTVADKLFILSSKSVLWVHWRIFARC